MKRIYLFLLFSCVAIWGYGQRDVRFYMNSGEIKALALERVDSIFFDESETMLFLAFEERVERLPIADLDSICYGELPPCVDIVYDADKAMVMNPFAFDSVAIAVDGAKVEVDSRIGREIEYRLSGASEIGAFKMYGLKKYTLTLDGVSLANDCGAAINIQCGKRGRVLLASGKQNTLVDATDYSSLLDEDEKAAFFSEGQLVFEGDGALNVTSLRKHAICSDDYIEVRSGAITVPYSFNDALHANDSIIISGGEMSFKATGDGIDCDGDVRFSGGILSMELHSNDIKGIKSGGNVFVSGGKLSLNMGGIISKGIKSVGSTEISGGDVEIVMSGNSKLIDGEPSYATAIKSDSTVNISGGIVSLTATGLAGRGISADGCVNIIDGSCTIVCSGDNEIYEPSDSDNDEEGTEADEPSYVIYVNKPSGTNMGDGRPGATSSSSWGNIYLYDSNDNLIATLTNSVTINGVLFYYYDFGQAVTGTYYFKSDNYRNYTIKSETFSGLSSDAFYQIGSSYITSGRIRSYSLTDVTSSYAGGAVSSGSTTEKSFAAAGIKSDSDFVLSGGNHIITMSGNASKGIKSDADVHLHGGSLQINTSGNAAIVAADPSYCTAVKCDGDFILNSGRLSVDATGMGGMGVSADGALSIKGGEAVVTVSGSGSSYTSASGTDYYSVKCLKSDGTMELTGGNILCRATGNGGKCIVSDALLTIGGGVAQLTLDARTSGSALGTSSSGGMGGGMNSGFNGAPKAVKGKSDVVINSGDIYVETKADGGEGIESKATLTVNGGNIECNTYDDGMNATNSLIVNGGCIYSHASNNDGIDSNGTININGGIILSSGASAPEEGFDCDRNSFVITGGVLLGSGGATSTPTSASQYYSSLSSVTVTSGRYLSVKNNSGEVLFSYLCPNSVNGATILLSSPEFTATSHTLMYGVTSVAGAVESHFDGVFLVGGTLSGGSSKSFTPAIR